MRDDDAPSLDPAVLERLRRGVPLSLTATGAFRFGDDPVTHPRVAEALRFGLDRTDNGEFIVRLGAQWCYLSIDDCPYRVRAVESAADGATLRLRLDDGREVELVPKTLFEEPDRGLWCEVLSRSGRPMPARFSNSAAMDLSTWVHDDPAAPRPHLKLGSTTITIETGAARPVSEDEPS